MSAPQSADSLVPIRGTNGVLPVMQMLAQVRESIVLVGADGKLLWLSDDLRRRYRAPNRSLAEWTRFVTDPQAPMRLGALLCRDGSFSDEPIEIVEPDGTRSSVRVSAARIGPDGAPTVAILRFGDEAAERALRESLATLTPVLESCPDAVVVVDSQRSITYANPEVEAVLGYRPEELRDSPLALLVRSEEDVEALAEAIAGAPVRGRDLLVRHRSGASVYVSVSASVLRGFDGRSLGAVAYLRDVTDQRRSEERLAQKNEELEHYVHAVSHDLRSPLVSILGFTRLLREDCGEALDGPGAGYLGHVERAGRTMEALIHDLLELSRVGRDPDREVGPTNPRPVLLQLSAELKPRLDEAGVTLRLPEDPPLVRCDRTELYQLFANLVGNALDHMGPASTPEVGIEIVPDHDGARITVADNGRGVPQDQHERIFEVFQSLGSGSQRRGTGIGLAIVRKIAESHGGRAWVESTPERGAAFHVLLR